MRITLFTLVSIGMLSPIFAETYSVQSPNGKNEIALDVKDGLFISISQKGASVIKHMPIALEIEGAVAAKSVPVKNTIDTTENDKIRPPVYKKREIVVNGKRKKIIFENNTAITLVAYDDGVAYRWETTLSGIITVLNEKADLVFTEDNQVFATYNNDPYNKDLFQNSFECLYDGKKVSELNAEKMVLLPLYVKTQTGCMTVSETDLLDYPGWNLFAANKQAVLKSGFARFPVQEKVVDDQRYRRVHARENFIARTPGTRTFPWRTFTLADRPAELLNADLNYKLASPCVLGDVSWIKTGQVAWDWWNEWNVTGVDFRAGCNTETYKYYIDFASKYGIRYVILDEGWSKKLKIMEISDDVDLKTLLAYAEKKNVGLILWAAWPQFYNRQEEIISHYAKMGAKGFKIDFFDRDDQDVLQYMEKTAQVAANYKVLLAYHGTFKPAGMHRKYPNLINYEAVFGLEQVKWGDANRDFMRHDTIIPFTRMVAGPMDYTAGAMKNQTRKHFKPTFELPSAQGTRVHQMTLLMLLEGPLQMMCDSPSEYLKNPECTEFLSQIPTKWDEVIGIDGEPGQFCILARRVGDLVYIGAIGNWDKREYELDLSTVLAKKTYTATIFKDGINADRNPEDWKKEIRTVNGADKIKIVLQPGGGWIGRFELAQ